MTLRATGPLAFDRSQAIAQAQAAFRNFRPQGPAQGPQAQAAAARMVADTAQRTGLSPQAVAQLFQAYQQAQALPFSPQDLGKLQLSAQAYLQAQGQAPSPAAQGELQEASWLASLSGRLTGATGPSAPASALLALLPLPGGPALAGLAGSLAGWLAGPEEAFRSELNALATQSEALELGGARDAMKDLSAGAKSARTGSQQALDTLKAAAARLGIDEGHSGLRQLDRGVQGVQKLSGWAEKGGQVGGKGLAAVEGGGQVVQGLSQLEQGDLSGARSVVQGSDAIVGALDEAAKGLQGVAERRQLPPNSKLSQGLDRFERGTRLVRAAVNLFTSGDKLVQRGEKAASTWQGLSGQELVQGVHDVGSWVHGAATDVQSAAKTVRSSLETFRGAATGGVNLAKEVPPTRATRLLNAMTMEGARATKVLGTAGGSLAALGGAIQIGDGVGALREGKTAEGVSKLLGGSAKVGEGVIQVAKVVAPAGKLATTIGGRALPALGVVSGVAQSVGALAKEPPDLKSAATGAASAVGSALLPFAPVGTAVGGALIVGAAIVDNWDAITAMGSAASEGAQALASQANEAFSEGLSAVSSWFA